MILIISLLALIAGVFALRGKKLFDRYLFDQEVIELKNDLALAAQYACCYQIDVEIDLISSCKGLILFFKIEDPHLSKDFLFSKKKLYRSLLVSKEVSSIVFSSTGWVIPTGNIILMSKDFKKVEIKLKESLLTGDS